MLEGFLVKKCVAPQVPDLRLRRRESLSNNPLNVFIFEYDYPVVSVFHSHCTNHTKPSILLIGDSNDRILIVNVFDEFHGRGSNFGGADFISRNGLQKQGFDGSLGAPIKTINFSDLHCELEYCDLFFLQIFGSGEGPYHLGLCNPSSQGFAGPYCNTTSRIERGLKLLNPIDFVVYQSVGWDVAQKPTNYSALFSNTIFRIQQITGLSSNRTQLWLRTVPNRDGQAVSLYNE